MAALPQTQSRTSAAIVAAWEAREKREHDATLRCSGIGNPCDRALWYGFRWAQPPEQFDGRMLRLFETGNIEEDRIVSDLRLIGCDVLATDPDTEKQFEVRFLSGHLTGHTDGEVIGVLEAPKTPHLLEAKSHNEKSFGELKRFGVQKSKPVHYAQMQIYMHGRSLTRALYVAVNKNTDEIYNERIEYDIEFCLRLLERARWLATSNSAPPKCGWCPPWCRVKETDFALRNCRTCIHATAEMDGDARWTCARFRRDLTLEAQKLGCHHHLYLPSLVPGEQIDADSDRETITYRLANGDTWTDAAYLEPEDAT
jgi:hypothetical protein